MGDILKFLSGKPSDTPAASSSTSNAAATAHRPTITSRLSSLTSKPPAPKPSDDRVSASILALQVFKTSKRAGGKGRSAAAGEDVIGVLDDDDDDNCRGNTTDRSSTGSRRARKRPRSSGLDAGSAARASSSAFPRTLSPASSGSSRPTTAASSINGFDFPPAESQGTGRGSPSSNSYRNNRFIANGKDHSEGGSKAGYRRDSSGGNTNGVMVAARKMGPWIKRKRERAVCEEDDYDPLELMRDANQDIFGNDAFRGVQEDVIRATLCGHDCFVLMPTGGGKSLCYQLPACLSKGVTFVLSPLLSLIEDQVTQLLKAPCGGVPAAHLTSATPASLAQQIYKDLARARAGREPSIKLLYLTPERLGNSGAVLDFMQVLHGQGMLARFVIDEAHCVSSWGHDFRQDYGKLGLIKKAFPDVPMLALTATATPTVRTDIIKSLGLVRPAEFVQSFNRTNLFFRVEEKPNSAADAMEYVAKFIEKQNNAHPGRRAACGIVYCMTKKDTSNLSDFLKDRGIKADYYHAGQGSGERTSVQGSWQRGDISVVCATIAYGMGIDKPDVRYVVHMSIAKSVEGYYQEAGRAGRDGQRAVCLMLYRRPDVTKVRQLIMGFGKGRRGPRKSSAAKNRDLGMLEKMQEYCEEEGVCRRKYLAHYFGEQYNPSMCGGLCDHCAKRELKPPPSQSSRPAD